MLLKFLMMILILKCETHLHSLQDFFRLKTVNCMLQASQGIFLLRLIW